MKTWKDFPYLDKLINFCVGFTLHHLLYDLCGVWWSLLIVFIISLLKEVYDSKMGNWDNVEIQDIYAVNLGSLFSLAILYFFSSIDFL